ncbi:PilW family protein [Candidatus Omnitrophota bacterium]
MKKPSKKRGVTLFELLVAITLISLVILAFSSIDTFSRFHVLTSERRAKVQNDASYILEHMAQSIGRAIGNERINGAESVVFIRFESNINQDRLTVFLDTDGDGIRDENLDFWTDYRVNYNPPSENEFRHCPQCSSQNCNYLLCTPGEGETLSNRITGFTPFVRRDLNDNTLVDNFIDLSVTVCWDPSEAQAACGTPDNPSVNMNGRVQMPSVSTN